MHKHVFAVLVCALLSSPLHAALVYQLDPGSRITILGTGATEELTGSFTWEIDHTATDFTAFTPTALQFDSSSVSIRLETASLDRTGSILFRENDPDRCMADICRSFFGANMLAPSLSEQMLGFSPSGMGDYEGDMTAPTRVTYSGLQLLPYYGGAFVAHIDFSASLTPVPVPAAIWGFASALGLLWHRGFSARRHSRG